MCFQSRLGLRAWIWLSMINLIECESVFLLVGSVGMLSPFFDSQNIFRPLPGPTPASGIHWWRCFGQVLLVCCFAIVFSRFVIFLINKNYTSKSTNLVSACMSCSTLKLWGEFLAKFWFRLWCATWKPWLDAKCH